MKTYKVTPKNLNCVKEINTWTKDFNGKSFTVSQEIVWSTGEFTLTIPEAELEISDISRYVVQKARDSGSFKTLPQEDIESFHSDDYFFEMDFTSNATSEEWSVIANDEELDDEDLAMIAEIKEGAEEGGEEFLFENEWDEDLNDFCIVDGITITEV